MYFLPFFTILAEITTGLGGITQPHTSHLYAKPRFDGKIYIPVYIPEFSVFVWVGNLA